MLAEVTRREAELIPAIAQQLQSLELRTTADTLESLFEYFHSDGLGELVEQAQQTSRKRRKKSGSFCRRRLKSVVFGGSVVPGGR